MVIKAFSCVGIGLLLCGALFPAGSWAQGRPAAVVSFTCSVSHREPDPFDSLHHELYGGSALMFGGCLENDPTLYAGSCGDQEVLPGRLLTIPSLSAEIFLTAKDLQAIQGSRKVSIDELMLRVIEPGKDYGALAGSFGSNGVVIELGQESSITLTAFTRSNITGSIRYVACDLGFSPLSGPSGGKQQLAE